MSHISAKKAVFLIAAVFAVAFALGGAGGYAYYTHTFSLAALRASVIFAGLFAAEMSAAALYGVYCLSRGTEGGERKK